MLFGVGSRFYTGKRVTVTTYRKSQIKNSFGVKELRYKVRMLVQIGSREMHAWFTLANRANNRYPILIGRKTLHGRFLVDVTKRPAAGARRILMLSTKRTSVTQKYADNLAKALKDVGVTYAAYEDLAYYTGLPKSRIALRDSDIDIADFDLVYFKTTSRCMDVAAAAARYLESRQVPFIDEAIKHFPSTSKLYQYILLEQSSMLVPKSIFMLPEPLAGSFTMLQRELGLPFILKDIHGNKGEHNYLVTDEASFTQACTIAAESAVQCVAQAFVANDSDYRVLVLGNRVALVIKRTRTHDDTHLNNTSQGADAVIVPVSTLPPAIQKACQEAAKLVERHIAGVDIVQEKHTGVWYCLDFNDGPQLASGSFVTEKYTAVADYLKRKLG
jgi:glutathione synthase/RimK-type ligase-like ATP-grasp enzyme